MTARAPYDTADWVLRQWVRRAEAFVREPFGYRWPESEGRTHTLSVAGPYRTIEAHFTQLTGWPGLVRLRSVNWRVENEPSGFMRVGDARRLWRELRRAGMAWTESRLGHH